MDFKNIIFDFDGTLADTTANILATMHQTISELGLPPRTDDECRATIGLRLEDIPPVLWPEVQDISEKYAATYRRIFEEVKKKLRVCSSSSNGRCIYFFCILSFFWKFKISCFVIFIICQLHFTFVH